MEIRICHLYPEVLNLYGDRGNILCMQRRLAWRGIESTVTLLPIGEKADLTQFDLFFIGGGQDFEQEVLLEDLNRGKADDIRAAIEDGKTFLTICGGYQMLGHYYETADGSKCEFLGAVDLYTKAGPNRMIENYAFQLTDDLGGSIVVGFENHGGRTYLGDGVKPLGHVIAGGGNNGEDKTEGVHYKNVFGTYSHGPVLPKNPDFCDEILRSALTRKYGTAELLPEEADQAGATTILAPLPDEFELLAHDSVLEKIRAGKI